MAKRIYAEKQTVKVKIKPEIDTATPSGRKLPY